jgi:hypothetical protein
VSQWIRRFLGRRRQRLIGGSSAIFPDVPLIPSSQPPVLGHDIFPPRRSHSQAMTTSRGEGVSATVRNHGGKDSTMRMQGRQIEPPELVVITIVVRRVAANAARRGAPIFRAAQHSPHPQLCGKIRSLAQGGPPMRRRAFLTRVGGVPPAAWPRDFTLLCAAFSAAALTRS